MRILIRLRRPLLGLMTGLCAALWAGSVTGQQPGPFAPQVPERCPYRDPWFTGPAEEVAWAAHLWGKRSGEPAPADVAAALAALQRLSGDASDEAARAVLHLLHALRLREPKLDPRVLAHRCVGRAEIPRLDLLVRNASPDGRELLVAFQELTPQDVAWEFVGGCLALRAQRNFAVELWSRWPPHLYVSVQENRVPVLDAPPPFAPLPDDAPGALPGFPPPPVYMWHRGYHNLIDVDVRPEVRLQDVARANPLSSNRARARWLAALAGEPDPQVSAGRFECVLRPDDFGDCTAKLAAARTAAEQRLAAFGEALVRKKLVPEARAKAAPLVLEVHDRRSPVAQRAQPLPEALQPPADAERPTRK